MGRAAGVLASLFSSSDEDPFENEDDKEQEQHRTPEGIWARIDALILQQKIADQQEEGCVEEEAMIRNPSPEASIPGCGRIVLCHDRLPSQTVRFEYLTALLPGRTVLDGVKRR